MKEGVVVPEKPKIFLPDNVSLTILFVKHESASDLGDTVELKRRLKNTDIFIPEEEGYNPSVVDYYRKVAKGYKKPLTEDQYRSVLHPFPEYTSKLMETVFNTQTNILLVDSEDSSQEYLNELEWQKFRDMFENIFRVDFDEAINFLDEHLKLKVKIYQERESKILSRLGPFLRDFIAQHPKLRGKKVINVVMLYGSLHRNLYNQLSSIAENQRSATNRDTPSVSFEFLKPHEIDNTDPINTILRYYHLFNNPEFKINDNELRHQLIRIMGIFLLHIYPNIDYYTRLKVVEKLTEPDIKKIYEIIKEAFILDPFNKKILAETIAKSDFWTKITLIIDEVTKTLTK